MPRIAILFEYPSLLGGERSLLAGIERIGSEFAFLAIAPPVGRLAEALHAAGIGIVPSPLFDAEGRKQPRELVLEDLAALVASHHIDHLHGNSLAMGRLTGMLGERVAIPRTAHLRDIIKLSGRAVADLNCNTRLFAVSEATRLYHIHQGIDSARVTTLYNGVDIDRFQPQPRDWALRHELEIPENAFVTLTIGQIGLRKGWDVLAQAMAILAPRRPDLYSLFVGERYSGKQETIDYEQSFRTVLNDAMPGRVRFLGYRDDIPRLFAAADLLIHPAREEPFGRVLLEAAAAGCPIIATDVGGTREMLGETAHIIPPGDPEQLAAAIEALAADPNQRRTLSQAARARIAINFNADQSAHELSKWLSVNKSPVYRP